MSQLTIEQQFAIASFNAQADLMTREQAIDFLKTLHQSYVVQKHTYNELLKQQWFPEHESNQRPAT